MRDIRDFRPFYQQQLRPLLLPLEARRTQMVVRIAIVFPVIACLVAIAVVLVGDSGFLFWVPIVALLAFFIAWVGITDGYASTFKAQLIAPMVAFYDAGLRYQPSGLISLSEFRAAGLFRDEPIDEYGGDDLVSGKLGATAVRFSEVHAAKIVVTHGRHGATQRSQTIFKGLFFIADFNKDFRGSIYVLPDLAQKWLGSIGQALQGVGSSYGQLVKLEDPQFEREFVVYASDQIEARYVLSSALMQRILDFRRRRGRSMHLAFVNSTLYLAIDMSRDLFEPRLFRSILDPSMFEEFWNDLDLAAGIVDELNLNTRIWSKK